MRGGPEARRGRHGRRRFVRLRLFRPERVRVRAGDEAPSQRRLGDRRRARGRHDHHRYAPRGPHVVPGVPSRVRVRPLAPGRPRARAGRLFAGRRVPRVLATAPRRARRVETTASREARAPLGVARDAPRGRVAKAGRRASSPPPFPPDRYRRDARGERSRRSAEKNENRTLFFGGVRLRRESRRLRRRRARVPRRRAEVSGWPRNVAKERTREPPPRGSSRVVCALGYDSIHVNSPTVRNTTLFVIHTRDGRVH